VTNAADVAKAFARLVLTKRALADVLTAVQTSRRIRQRMPTQTLKYFTKTLRIALFLSAGHVAHVHRGPMSIEQIEQILIARLAPSQAPQAPRLLTRGRSHTALCHAPAANRQFEAPSRAAVRPRSAAGVRRLVFHRRIQVWEKFAGRKALEPLRDLTSI